MKLVVLKNHLGGRILYRSLDHVKKNSAKMIKKLSENEDIF